MSDIPPGKMIVLFDGLCNLCDRSVQFILQHDRDDQFLFGSLQGAAGKTFLEQYHLAPDLLYSFLLIENKKMYSRSSAALRVARHLTGAWPLLYGLMVVPKFIRDAVYNYIARNRYKWFGKKESCMVPLPEYRDKFLD